VELYAAILRRLNRTSSAPRVFAEQLELRQRQGGAVVLLPGQGFIPPELVEELLTGPERTTVRRIRAGPRLGVERRRGDCRRVDAERAAASRGRRQPRPERGRLHIGEEPSNIHHGCWKMRVCEAKNVLNTRLKLRKELRGWFVERKK